MKLSKWKPVPFDASLSSLKEFDSFGGIDELIDYKIVKCDKTQLKSRKRKSEDKLKRKRKSLKMVNDGKLETKHAVKDAPDMSAWCNCFISEPILQALRELNFMKPTPIQEFSIPAALRDHQDILGAAETGSGKTLAFGIPIISHIISAKEREKSGDYLVAKNPLRGLVLTPTRELAMQVKSHLQAICTYTDIKIAAVVGGMAPEKQRRILKKFPDLIVATPGRLWELIEEGEPHLSKIPNVRYLVIDEADRMLEKGHFPELMQILSLVNGGKISSPRQTFVFSATLTLVHDVPKRFANKSRKGKNMQKEKLESLVSLIGMKENPKVIDITRKAAVVETLTESQILCSTEEKDTYLYYFLLMYPGRTLVFCNSIDCVRRLRHVLEFLNCNPLPLHASMHQRQRLKNLENFESCSTGVLLATDVAARGLDIKGIEHVIHFQVPRTAEIYVHRSGRTARAQNEGLSLMLVEPQDIIYYRKICKTLNKDKTLPSFPIDHNILKTIKERVTLVRTIETSEHRMQRLMAQNRWFLNAAKEMNIEIEDENLLNDLGDDQERATRYRQIKAMKTHLKSLLNKPIVPKIFTGSFPTKAGKLQIPSTLGTVKAVTVVKKDAEKIVKKGKLGQRKKALFKKVY